MKILISHSSKNAAYGSALVNLLTSVGVPHDRIVFTSDTSYGIPVGKNIFHWLRDLISEKPFVIYLLSPEYYSSVACLNEMGAAWIVESQHATIFTPTFDLDSQEFRSGAIDPREIGFFINDEDRVTEFIDSLKLNFEVVRSIGVINRKVREFLADIARISDKNLPSVRAVLVDSSSDSATMPQTDGIYLHTAPPEMSSSVTTFNSTKSDSVSETKIITVESSRRKIEPTDRYFQDLSVGKLKDEEVMLIHYAADTARVHLGVGWRMQEEVARIIEWEKLNELGNTLSKNYEMAIKRLDLRKLLQVSEFTSHGNPRQVTIIKQMQEILLDLPDEFYSKCDEIKVRSSIEQEGGSNTEIPF